MKSFAALAVLLFATVRVLADDPAPTPAPTPAPAPAPTRPSDDQPVKITISTAPATTVTTTAPVVKKDAAKPVKPIVYVIKGLTIPRANGTFLGMEVEGGKFKFSFYDKKKKPMPVDVTGGLIRWPNVRGPGENRSPLNISGTALISAKPALPPYTYNVFVTLLIGTGEQAKAAETFTIPYRG